MNQETAKAYGEFKRACYALEESQKDLEFSMRLSRYQIERNDILLRLQSQILTPEPCQHSFYDVQALNSKCCEKCNLIIQNP